MAEANIKEPLDTVARRIEQHANQSTDLAIVAGKLILEARGRVEAGEAGKISWSGWARENIDLSSSRLRELVRIAKAKDPATAAKQQRAATRKRGAAHRAAKAAETQNLDPERQDLIVWAKEAPIDRVKQVLDQIGQLDGTSLEAQPTEATREAA